MNKIFEKRGYIDGGPTDRGWCEGFIIAKSKEEATKILNINHGFIQLHEISKQEFLKRKQEAWKEYKLYKDIKI